MKFLHPLKHQTGIAGYHFRKLCGRPPAVPKGPHGHIGKHTSIRHHLDYFRMNDYFRHTHLFRLGGGKKPLRTSSP